MYDNFYMIYRISNFKVSKNKYKFFKSFERSIKILNLRIYKRRWNLSEKTEILIEERNSENTVLIYRKQY